ncbi:MAG: hypothetical protein ACKVOX_10830 [Rhizobacter sp.]
MASHINPAPSDATRHLAARRPIGWGLCLAALLAGCGGDAEVATGGGGGGGVPAATQIADAQAALDGTVPTDDSIDARQAALDADADKDPE